MSALTISRALHGTRNGKGYICRCPVPSHGRGKGDKNPSLSISDGTDGKLLVKCFAGCNPCDVLAELRNRGLTDGPGTSRRKDSRLKLIRQPKPEPEPEPEAR